MTTRSAPFGIYFEHPDWFRPLFNELDRRGIAYDKLPIASSIYDVRESQSQYRLVFNRMSPSAYLRGLGSALFYTGGYLAHLESQGVRVINGSRAWGYEISKARQLTRLRQLGLGYPAARVVHRAEDAPLAAEGLRFPVVVKANIGGSGAGIVRYDTPAALKKAAAEATIDLGMDSTALVQEYVRPRGGYITRVETLGGKFLYAINVHTTGESFNLCPADICQTTGGVELVRGACAVDAARSGLRVEAYTPPASIIDAVEAIARETGLDVGGIEYMVDDRDGQVLYYDVNALSNFVADAPRVIGFDPHEKLVDFLVREGSL